MKIIGLDYDNNLGDYLQQYLIEEKFGKADIRVHRDSLDTFVPKTKCRLYLNCYLNKLDKPLHELIDVVFYSVHITPILQSKIKSNNELLLWLKAYNIGCRDIATFKFLKSLDISCHLKDCISLSLKKSTVLKEGVTVIDVPEKYATGNRLTNVRTKTNYSDMVLECRKVLEQVSKSAKVYTSRLHIALPCLAMGIPCEFIHFNIQDGRFAPIKNTTIKMKNYI